MPMSYLHLLFKSLLLKWGVRYVLFFFSSRRRHTRLQGDWSSDVCSSDLSVPGSHRFLWVASFLTWGLKKWICFVRFARAAGARSRWCPSRSFLPLSLKPPLQIGRASCRGGVWVVGGGAVLVQGAV